MHDRRQAATTPPHRLARPWIAGCLGAALALASLGMTADATAETRYVSDELFVSLREGPGNQFERIRFLQTGHAVEVLDPPGDVDEDADLETWAYVRDENDDTGWMQERYLMEEPAARDRLADVEAALAEAEDEIQRLRTERDEAVDELDDARAEAEARAGTLEQELETARARIEELESQLDEAAAGYELVEANERLQERVEVLLERAESLEETNRQLADRRDREWFLTGAGVLLAGLLVGLVAPMLRRRRSTWSGSGL